MAQRMYPRIFDQAGAAVVGATLLSEGLDARALARSLTEAEEALATALQLMTRRLSQPTRDGVEDIRLARAFRAADELMRANTDLKPVELIRSRDEARERRALKESE